MHSEENPTSVDAVRLLQRSAMSPFQVIAVALCVLINALDGFDVMVVAFTAAPISREWGLSATDVGILFSSGLLGMALGAIFVAPVGDRYGRRPLILGCQAAIVCTMIATAYSASLWQFAGLRVLTGIGIGGLLASINIMVAEYSSDRRRTLCIGVMSLGYPLGAAIGGLISMYLITSMGWRSVYWFGGLASLAALLLSIVLLPESLSFLLLGRRNATLTQVNRLLHKMKQPAISSLPPPSAIQALEKPGLLNILRGGYARTTVIMGLIYTGVMVTVYFALNWTPKILTQLGYSDTTGISASLVMNLSGAIACLLMGIYANKLGLRRTASFTYIGLCLSVAWFGLTSTGFTQLMISVAVVGFFLFSTIAISYALVPSVFPAEIRLTGMGACLAFGRIGGVLGPYLAGVLIDANWSRAGYCLALGLPILGAAILLPLIQLRDASHSSESALAK
jgi:benzoate transport